MSDKKLPSIDALLEAAHADQDVARVKAVRDAKQAATGHARHMLADAERQHNEKINASRALVSATDSDRIDPAAAKEAAAAWTPGATVAAPPRALETQRRATSEQTQRAAAQRDVALAAVDGCERDERIADTGYAAALDRMLKPESDRRAKHLADCLLELGRAITAATEPRNAVVRLAGCSSLPAVVAPEIAELELTPGGLAYCVLRQMRQTLGPHCDLPRLQDVPEFRPRPEAVLNRGGQRPVVETTLGFGAPRRT